MEQRPLRLGDVVDDYCPRERRITNHAIVALIGDAIRQTRCTTCDAEHVFRDGKAPRRIGLRRKDGDVHGQLVQPRAAAPEPTPAVAAEGAGPPPSEVDNAPSGVNASAEADADQTPPVEEDRAGDAWMANRPLIRATLPRTENDPPAPRPIPEFTMHQRNMRGGRAFRQAQGWQGGNGQPPNGFRHGRPGNDRQGQGHGPGRHGQGGGKSGRHRGGNKRSR